MIKTTPLYDTQLMTLWDVIDKLDPADKTQHEFLTDVGVARHLLGAWLDILAEQDWEEGE